MRARLRARGQLERCALVTLEAERRDQAVSAVRVGPPVTPLYTTLQATIEDPNLFGSVGIQGILQAVGDLLEALLGACDLTLQAFLDIASLAMEALQTLLSTPIQVDALQALWTWLATAAGYPNDNALTVSSLVALIAAFPTTVLYKLVLGVDQEPFPNAQLSLIGATTDPLGSGAMLASAILQTVTAMPAVFSDMLGPNSPTWLNLLLLGDSILIWVLANGFPDLSTLTWAAIGIVAANLLWIAPTVYFVMQSVANALHRGRRLGQVMYAMQHMNSPRRRYVAVAA